MDDLLCSFAPDDFSEAAHAWRLSRARSNKAKRPSHFRRAGSDKSRSHAANKSSFVTKERDETKRRARGGRLGGVLVLFVAVVPVVMVLSKITRLLEDFTVCSNIGTSFSVRTARKYGALHF